MAWPQPPRDFACLAGGDVRLRGRCTTLPRTASAAAGTLERWLTGPRFGALPAREAQHPVPALSFEFFPPKTEALETQLWHCIRRLEPLAPRFVSVTYGAGGSTQERTHATVSRIVTETTLTPAAHLTCVAATRAQVDAIAHRYWEARDSPHRGAARRRAGGRALRAASGGLCVRGRPGGGAEAGRRFRDFRRGLSRGASGGAAARTPTSTT